MNKTITIGILGISVGMGIGFVIFNTSLFGSPNINASCTTRGTGEGRCTFHNTGTSRGTQCLRVIVARAWHQETRKNDKGELVVGDNYFVMPTTAQPQIIRSDRVCSGIVEASDVVERNFIGFTTDGNYIRTNVGAGDQITPEFFCKPPIIAAAFEEANKDRYFPLPPKPWNSYCTMQYEIVTH